MNVLGVELSESLAAFYQEVEALLGQRGITLTCEQGPGPEFGGFYLSGDRATVQVRHDLPPDAIQHTLGHELVHGLQRQEGWPRAAAGPDPLGKAEAEEVAAVLQALVQCAAAELRISPLGLDPSWEQRQRHEGIRRLLRAPHPEATERGTASWAYWSLLYAYLSLLHPAESVRTLLRNFDRALPTAAAAGRQAVELVRQHGYATADQGLAAMVAVQQALELAPRVVVEDPRAGAVHE